MKTNEFKNGIAPRKPMPDVMISEKELAMYNYIRLKIEHQRDQAQQMVDKINAQRERVAANAFYITTRSIAAVIILTVVGLILERIL